MINELSVRGLGATLPALVGRPLHLHGAIVTPTGFIPNGTVIIVDGRISEVRTDRTPAAPEHIDVDSGGVLCPGFLDTHNHAAYAAFRRWYKPSRYFRSRFDWRGKTRCGVIVVPEPDPYYGTYVSRPFKAIAASPESLRDLTLYGQVRGVIGGATTMVIDADLTPDVPVPLPGFVRDPCDWPGRVWGVLDVGCIAPDVLPGILKDLDADAAKLLVHAGEGVDEFSRGEFLALAAKGLLTRNTVIVHALALLDADWRLLRERGTSVIWSPVSNYRLYGRSIDIGQALGAGIRVALAPDWTISGSSTVLDELAFVRSRYGWIGDEVLLDMVTTNAADVMGMPSLGRLVPGALADILVFPAGGIVDRPTAACRIVKATPGDLRLVLVGGTPVLGTADALASFPLPTQPRETIAFPLADGTSVTRQLQLDDARSFGETTASLSAAFTAQQLSIAPLWERTWN